MPADFRERSDCCSSVFSTPFLMCRLKKPFEQVHTASLIITTCKLGELIPIETKIVYKLQKHGLEPLRRIVV